MASGCAATPCEQGRETVPEQLGGVALEQVGVVVHAALEPARHFHQPQAEILRRALLHHEHGLVLQRTPTPRPLARVLEREQRLVQARLLRHRGDLALLGEALERHFLVGEQVEHLALDPGHAGRKRHVEIQSQVDGQQVVEEAHHRLDFGREAPAHRDAHHDRRAADGLPQHAGQTAIVSMLSVASKRRPTRAQLLGERLVDVHPLHRTGACHAGLARPVGRDRSGRLDRLETLLPVLHLAAEFIAAHPLLLPLREVAVRDLEWRERAGEPASAAAYSAAISS